MSQSDIISSNVDRPYQDLGDHTVVLMATYNGAAFLEEQLRSLRNQTDTKWVLITRDDHSTDSTTDILDSFAMACEPGQVVRIPSGPARLGFLGNFLTLLASAPVGARYAFCDQDDVWLPNKLMRASQALRGYRPDTPMLYCSRQAIVDADLRPSGLSLDMKRSPSLGNALVQNIATGNTVVMNASAQRAILEVRPPSKSFHDWWSYLVVAATGGHIIYDPSPSILYRQHRENSVGSPRNLWLRLLGAATRGPDRFMCMFLEHAETLLRHPNLTMEARSLLEECVALSEGSVVSRLRRVFQLTCYRQNYIEDITVKFWMSLWCMRNCKPHKGLTASKTQ